MKTLPLVHPPTRPRQPIDRTPQEQKLWQALSEVIDPEFPVSVVDMGLICGLRYRERNVQIKLTFTAMGCPCMDFIIQDIQTRLLHEPEVDSVDIEIVWDPPWTRDRLTPEAIEKLKQWGVSA